MQVAGRLKKRFDFGFLLYEPPHVSGEALVVLLVTTLLHLLYLLVLQRGYRAGDLSVVYPLARGTGPALSMLGAILLLDERPPLTALIGAALVISGVVLLTWRTDTDRSRTSTAAVGYGILCGMVIAAYTICDKFAVSNLKVPPPLIPVCFNLGIAAMLSPYAWRNRPKVRTEWKNHKREIVAIAVLYPAAYLMVLMAMVFTPVSYVAPAREIGILFGAVLGTRLLGEERSLRRLLAAGIMVAGLIVLALA